MITYSPDRTFLGFNSFVSAGNLALINLYNPPASGKRLLLIRAIFTIDTAGDIGGGRDGTVQAAANSTRGFLKWTDGAPPAQSVAEIRRNGQVAVWGGMSQSIGIALSPQLPFEFDFRQDPIRIGESEGFSLFGPVGVRVAATYEWKEVDG